MQKKSASIKEALPVWAHKFLEKKNLFFVLSIILLLALAIAYQADPFFNKHDSKECMAAQRAYDNLCGLDNNPDKLNRILNRKNFLRPKYEGLLAQNFLTKGNLALAQSFAGRTFVRMEAELPFHMSYSKNSLLIADGRFDEALSSAKELKSAMAKDMQLWDNITTGGPLLYLYNLLRIAILEKTVKNEGSELFAWQEIENFLQYAEKKPFLAKITKVFSRTFFEDNKVKIQDYIESRKSFLSAKGP